VIVSVFAEDHHRGDESEGRDVKRDHKGAKSHPAVAPVLAFPLHRLANMAHDLAVGKPKLGSGLLREEGVSLGELESKASALRADGQTVDFVASASKAIGLLAEADPVRASPTRCACERRRVMRLEEI
jgi:hypothetical protein